MDKVKQLVDELYNQKVLDGWKNVSMETCLKRATDYYRMDKVVKKLTIPDVVFSEAELKAKLEEQKEEIKQWLIDMDFEGLAESL